MLTYEWPGNVRQLQNIIRNVVVLNSGGLISPSHLPAPLNDIVEQSGIQPGVVQPIETTASMSAAQSTVDNTARQFVREEVNPYAGILATTIGEIEPLETLERKIIENAIALCKGNIPKAAAMLEVSPSTLYRKMKHWD